MTWNVCCAAPDLDEMPQLYPKNTCQIEYCFMGWECIVVVNINGMLKYLAENIVNQIMKEFEVH